MPHQGESSYVPALRFRWLTPYYDLLVRLTTSERTFKNSLIERTQLRPGQRVLDLGCGTGTLAIQMAKRCPGAMIVAADAGPTILRIASGKAARLGRACNLTVQLHLPFRMPTDVRSRHIESFLSSSDLENQAA